VYSVLINGKGTLRKFSSRLRLAYRHTTYIRSFCGHRIFLARKQNSSCKGRISCITLWSYLFLSLWNPHHKIQHGYVTVEAANSINILVQLPNFVKLQFYVKRQFSPPKNTRNIILPLFSDPSRSGDHEMNVKIRMNILFYSILFFIYFKIIIQAKTITTDIEVVQVKTYV
jgi:hypothetical protein